MISDLFDSVERALGEYAENYDIDAIVVDLRGPGVDGIDDVPADRFWTVAAEHTLPDPGAPPHVSPVEQFRAEVMQAVGTSPGTPGVWKRGGVTLRIESHSRVNSTTPDPLAHYHLTTLGADSTRFSGHKVPTWALL
ncbi:hypothetical protein [Streptomyces sp. NPDC056061]|uniref:hypothetical protein n=1 Tax=Streptomyces sp. NPDC056061 TaxID=3345700 RepID=UPI0035D996F0